MFILYLSYSTGWLPPSWTVSCWGPSECLPYLLGLLWQVVMDTWLDQQTFFLHSSGGWKSKIWLLAQWLLLKFFGVMQMAFPWVFTQFSLVCVMCSCHLKKTSVTLDGDKHMALRPHWTVCITQSFKKFAITGVEPIHITSFLLNYFKGLISKASHILKYWN